MARATDEPADRPPNHEQTREAFQVRHRRQALALAAVGVAALLTAACGARLTAAQRQAVLGGASAGANSGANGGTFTGTEGGTGTTGAGTTGTSGTGTTGTGTTGSGTTGSGATGTTGTTGGSTSGTGKTTTGTAKPVPGASSAPASAAAGCGKGTLGASDTGVTASTITIGNASDITGPVPGLFTSAQDGVKAFVAYFNSSNQTVCGRHLVLKTYDSQTAESGDHDAATHACSETFALVGSESAYDQGGGPVVQQCGIPDLRSSVNTHARYAVPNSFGTESADEGHISSSIPDYFKQKFGDKVTQHAGFVYINVGVGAEQEKTFEGGYTADGYKFVYTAGIDISDFNYQPYAQAMKDRGVDLIGFVGAESQAARLAQAIHQTPGYNPDVFLLQPNAYDDTYPSDAGSAANGTYIYTDAALFSEASGNPEQQLYIQWLGRVDPQAKPSWFGEYAWSAARLFVETATKVGPNLTRKAFITQLKTVHAWTGNGINSPQDVGGKTTSKCFAVIQYNNGQWTRQSPAPYTCGTLLNTGNG
jgi:hypothetical protein